MQALKVLSGAWSSVSWLTGYSRNKAMDQCEISTRIIDAIRVGWPGNHLWASCPIAMLYDYFWSCTHEDLPAQNTASDNDFVSICDALDSSDTTCDPFLVS